MSRNTEQASDGRDSVEMLLGFFKSESITPEQRDLLGVLLLLSGHPPEQISQFYTQGQTGIQGSVRRTDNFLNSIKELNSLVLKGQTIPLGRDGLLSALNSVQISYKNDGFWKIVHHTLSSDKAKPTKDRRSLDEIQQRFRSKMKQRLQSRELVFYESELNGYLDLLFSSSINITTDNIDHIADFIEHLVICFPGNFRVLDSQNIAIFYNSFSQNEFAFSVAFGEDAKKTKDKCQQVLHKVAEEKQPFLSALTSIFPMTAPEESSSQDCASDEEPLVVFSVRTALKANDQSTFSNLFAALGDLYDSASAVRGSNNQYNDAIKSIVALKKEASKEEESKATFCEEIYELDRKGQDVWEVWRSNDNNHQIFDNESSEGLSDGLGARRGEVEYNFDELAIWYNKNLLEKDTKEELTIESQRRLTFYAAFLARQSHMFVYNLLNNQKQVREQDLDIAIDFNKKIHEEVYPAVLAQLNKTIQLSQKFNPSLLLPLYELRNFMVYVFKKLTDGIKELITLAEDVDKLQREFTIDKYFEVKNQFEKLKQSKQYDAELQHYFETIQQKLDVIQKKELVQQLIRCKNHVDKVKESFSQKSAKIGGIGSRGSNDEAKNPDMQYADKYYSTIEKNIIKATFNLTQSDNTHITTLAKSTAKELTIQRKAIKPRLHKLWDRITAFFKNIFTCNKSQYNRNKFFQMPPTKTQKQTVGELCEIFEISHSEVRREVKKSPSSAA